MLFKKHITLSSYHHKHVMLFLIDGLTSNIITNIKTSLANDLNFNMASNLTARAIIPALAAPNIASILTGAPLEFHAIDSFNGVNKQVTPIITTKYGLFPTLFWHCNQKNNNTFLYTQNNNILQIVEKSIISHIINDKKINIAAISNSVNKLQAPFNCFYLSDLNENGIKYGFESNDYFKSTTNLFTQITKLINNINFKNDSVIIIASTHGGIGKGITSTGGLSDDEVLIPHLILANKLKSQTLTNYYHQTDLALLVATILQFDLPQATRTKPIMNLFGGDKNE